MVLQMLGPLVAGAQQTGKVQRVGVLASGSPTTSGPFIEALRRGLHDLGWVEGRNVALDVRFAEGSMDRLAGLAAELVRGEPDVIVAGPSTVAQAARRATATIPIVMVGVGDPVALGFAASLSRPGGNMTGLASFLPELSAKSLQLFKELVPGVTRIAILMNPGNPAHEPSLKQTETAALALALTIVPVRARGPEEFAGAFDAMVAGRAGAAEIYGDPVFARHRDGLVTLALRARMPTMFRGRQDVEAGGLMAYGPDFLDLNRRAAVFVDRILKGAKPGELPIEQPTKLELLINMKTARVLGLAVPPALLLRADRVIE
jgi:putative ABC transport system substrate-binding protein